MTTFPGALQAARTPGQGPQLGLPLGLFPGNRRARGLPGQVVIVIVLVANKVAATSFSRGARGAASGTSSGTARGAGSATSTTA